MTNDALINAYWSSTDSSKVQRKLNAAANYGRADPAVAADARFVDRFVAPRYAGRTVLDFGAGPGRLVSLWARNRVRLTCADWSDAFMPALTAICGKFGSRALQLDVSKQCLDERFDLVFSTQVLLHIHPRHIDSAMRNICRMAKRDILVITWQGDDAFDDASSEKVQSFNHDYRALFAKHGCTLDLEMDITFGARRGRKEVTNKVYVLSAPDAAGG